MALTSQPLYTLDEEKYRISFFYLKAILTIILLLIIYSKQYSNLLSSEQIDIYKYLNTLANSRV